MAGKTHSKGHYICDLYLEFVSQLKLLTFGYVLNHPLTAIHLLGVIRSKKKNRKKTSFWKLLATVTILKWQTVMSVNKSRRENKTKQTKAFIL